MHLFDRCFGREGVLIVLYFGMDGVLIVLYFGRDGVLMALYVGRDGVLIVLALAAWESFVDGAFDNSRKGP